MGIINPKRRTIKTQGNYKSISRTSNIPLGFLSVSKRGQVVSVDLVVGIIIFVFALAIFYSQITSMEEKPSISFTMPVDYAFDGIEMALSDPDSGFANMNFFKDSEGKINGYRVDAGKLKEFASTVNDDYATSPSPTNKEKVLEFIDIPYQFKNMDFCIYFEDQSGAIVDIDTDTGPTDTNYGIGNKVDISDCGSSTTKPTCPAPDGTPPDYTHGLSLTRPVVYYDLTAGTSQIAKMHILLCAEQI